MPSGLPSTCRARNSGMGVEELPALLHHAIGDQRHFLLAGPRLPRRGAGRGRPARAAWAAASSCSRPNRRRGPTARRTRSGPPRSGRTISRPSNFAQARRSLGSVMWPKLRPRRSDLHADQAPSIPGGGGDPAAAPGPASAARHGGRDTASDVPAIAIHSNKRQQHLFRRSPWLVSFIASHSPGY